MFRHVCWKLMHFGVKRSKVIVTSYKKQFIHGFLHSCECWLLFIVCEFEAFINSSIYCLF